MRPLGPLPSNSSAPLAIGKPKKPSLSKTNSAPARQQQTVATNEPGALESLVRAFTVFGGLFDELEAQESHRLAEVDAREVAARVESPRTAESSAPAPRRLSEPAQSVARRTQSLESRALRPASRSSVACSEADDDNGDGEEAWDDFDDGADWALASVANLASSVITDVGAVLDDFLREEGDVEAPPEIDCDADGRDGWGGESLVLETQTEEPLRDTEDESPTLPPWVPINLEATSSDDEDTETEQRRREAVMGASASFVELTDTASSDAESETPSDASWEILSS